MAEEEGFEPPIPFQVRQFSRLEPSTTRPLFPSGKCSVRWSGDAMWVIGAEILRVQRTWDAVQRCVVIR